MFHLSILRKILFFLSLLKTQDENLLKAQDENFQNHCSRDRVIWIRITFIFLSIGFIIRFSGDIFWHSFHDYIFLRGKGNICINWYFAGLFFRWYFNKCELNYWFLWNAMVTVAQATLCFKVFNFRSAIDSLVYWMKWIFRWFLNWRWLKFAFSWLSRNGFF